MMAASAGNNRNLLVPSALIETEVCRTGSKLQIKLRYVTWISELNGVSWR